MKNHIVLAGFGSENNVKMLAETISQNHFNTTYLDLELPIEKLLNSLALCKEKKIFITSQHIAIDTESYKTFYPHAKYYIDPLSLQHQINPFYSIYVNHDYMEPLDDLDLKYHTYFDLFLLHTKQEIPRNLKPKTLDLGDVKSLAPMIEKNLAATLGKNGIFFLNNPDDFINKIMNNDYVAVRQLCNFLSFNRIPIKVHNDEIYSPIESFFSENGIMVIDRQLSTYQIIQNASFVVANGEGSIFQESRCQGKPLFWYDLDLGQNRTKELQMKKELNLTTLDVKIFTQQLHDIPKNNVSNCFFSISEFLSILDKV